MNNKFDELTKSLAQSVTRRAALKKFGVGIAGMALACFGLAIKTGAQTGCLTDGHAKATTTAVAANAAATASLDFTSRTANNQHTGLSLL